MNKKDYETVAEALLNFNELDKLVGETETVEEAHSILKLQGHDVAPIGDSEFGHGFIVRYKNIDTTVYKYNGIVVADPYIYIYNSNGECIMESMFMDDLENGLYNKSY